MVYRHERKDVPEGSSVSSSVLEKMIWVGASVLR